MRRGRRLAFDFGDVRIGVAVSDQDSILASPVETLLAKREDLWDRIFDLLAEFEPVHVYVGKPLHLSGNQSDSSNKADRFAVELRERFDVDVTLIDERFSTVSAQRSLRDSGVSTREHKNTIDQVAAVAILEMALEMEKSKAKRDDAE